MLTYLYRRGVGAVLTLWGVATLVFALLHLLPGDPAATLLAQSGASPEAIAALRGQLGLNLPLPAQYLNWLFHLARGDLGRSLFYSQPVSELIAANLPYTVQLALAALIWAALLGLPLGVLSALRPAGWLDRLAMASAVVGATVPVFWSGLLLIWLFSVRLGWLPSAGAEGWRSLVLPSLVLGYASAGPIARLTRATLLEVLSQPYITAARAKGLHPRQVLVRHAARNALAPVLALSGLQLGFLLGGTVVTESVFSRPGLGRLLVDAILWRDLPVVQGVALVIAGGYVLVNLGVDLISAWVNPQIGWQ